MSNKREFYVDTPMGKLKIWEKHEGVDVGEDYPGVYIDLVAHDEQGEYLEPLCVVEYESNKNYLQTVVYNFGREEPVIVHRHLSEEDASHA